ncbi:response regulator [bacterium 1xD8-6]|jgi:Response regulator containing a CheY-like receiver domain and an HD-GYP domain|nr:response regulator [bacterium D16-36]RKI69278.1 response regulator [bacterium 1xD8-6]
MNKSRVTILIVDDVEINRTILAEIFKDDYNILEADNGLQAIEMINGSFGISAVLLDLIMPGINGLEVLKEMNKSGKTDSIPVFLITAAESQKALMDGYQLGAVDVIMKPFMPNFIKCRINNVIELYAHRNKLEHIVAKQVERLNSLNQSMVETLATVIEFRDCESGEHVKRIGRLTKILMTQVSEMYPEHHLPETEIDKIVTSSILHDVGKISIPDRILNKPGRLTEEEFEIMKQHTVKGCEILQNIPDIIDEGVYKYSYDICRHHHERWDGRGYPDGLSGDDISIWAQVVSVADVYDALTAERVYKKAFSHEKAVQMIHDGECGTFSPKLLKAFDEVLDDIIVKE